MGSRAVVVVCRDEQSARKRFGVQGEGVGICYTRTGRRFFEDRDLESQLLDRVRGALERSGFWQEFSTDWACLDCELMPWSAKAQELLRSQYAAVGAAARASLPEAVAALETAFTKGPAAGTSELGQLLERYRERQCMAHDYVAAYRQYCWSVQSLADYRLAPFHLLATEGRVNIEKDHVWHMQTLGRVCSADHGLLLATPYQIVDIANPESQSAAVRLWQEWTDSGGEGMVVKPRPFVTKGSKGLAQPAVKCRGREYLRIIYGPEYTTTKNLTELRHRGLGAKRSLALREFALGIESLERFVRCEPLGRVHECVFGVLALESEPVDPRL